MNFKVFVQKSVTKFSLGDDVNKKRPRRGDVLPGNWELDGERAV